MVGDNSHNESRRRFLTTLASGIGLSATVRPGAARSLTGGAGQTSTSSTQSSGDTLDTKHGSRQDPIYPQYTLTLGSGIAHKGSYIVNAGYSNEEVVHLLGIHGNLTSTENGNLVKQIPWHGVEARSFSDAVTVEGIDYAIGAMDDGSESSGNPIPVSYRLASLANNVASLFGHAAKHFPVIEILSDIAYGLDWVNRELVPGEHEMHTWGRDTKRAAHQGILKFRYPTNKSPQVRLSSACTAFLQHDYFISPSSVQSTSTSTVSTHDATLDATETLSVEEQRLLGVDDGKTVQPVSASFEVSSETTSREE